jgi:LmbE family N-acetylglucosaminyl deacetylase
MRPAFPKPQLRARYRLALRRNTHPISAQELTENSLVFAPHQDDETLGCGGTLIQKRASDAQVAVVFMTDGRQSHANFLPPEELVPLRQQEALAACQAMGIASQDVHFLGNEDSRLGENFAQVVPAVKQLLEAYQPASVFMPYHQDVLPDHVATNQVVRSALQAWGRNITVYEYPVWFWFHWPWVSLLQNTRNLTRLALKNSLQFRFGQRLSQDFNTHANITPNLDQKKAALGLYRSQMEHLNGDPQWATLGDVSQGDFLSCFFQELEIFHRYEFHA